MSLEAACLRAREAAAQWLLESGIQEPSGGVARYYRTDLRANYRVSTEITGYAASTFVWLYRLSGDERLREAATRAANFLLDRTWDRASGLFPFEYAADGDFAEPLAYFFDNAIVVRGLLALWRLSRRHELLEAAHRCGAAMAREFPHEDGFHAALMLPDLDPAPADERWSRNPGCYHLKAALAWRELELAGFAGEFDAAWRRALDHALATSQSFLSLSPEAPVMDRLHAYLYFLEGLLACAERAECRRALADGIERVADLLERIAPAFERGDVRAQLLRVKLYADALAVRELGQAEAEREVSRILEFQVEDPDARIRGGFRFGRKAGQWMPYVNPYTTAFAVQALEMWRAWREGRFQPVWQELI